MPELIFTRGPLPHPLAAKFTGDVIAGGTKTPIVDADQTGLRRAAHATFVIFGEFTMPLESILFLSLVVGSLSAFAVALAYADWATNTVAPISDIATGRPASTAKTLNRYSADGALASR